MELHVSPIDDRLLSTLANINDTASIDLLSSTSLSSSSTSAFPAWLTQHPHADDLQYSSSSSTAQQTNSIDFTSNLPAILYGIFTTTLVVLFSLFWQLQRKIAYSDWVRNYKPSKLRNGCISGAVRPPNVKGHFLLGNGREFAEDAAGFLQRVGREYGDIATIRLMFRRIAVLTDVHSFSAFGHEPRFDFRPIVDQVNLNVFGYKVANVDDHKRRLLSFYKSSRMQDTVKLFDENLTNAMTTYDKLNNSTGEVAANDFLIDTGFAAIFHTILGGDASEECLKSKDYALFYSNYKRFMKYFNFLWLGLPIKLFPAASKSLQEMARVHPNVSGMPDDEGVCGYLRKACEAMITEGHKDSEIIGHNVEFIHVHINAIRLAYWMLLFILSDANGYAALLEEIDELVKQRRATSTSDDGNDVCLELEDVERLTALDSMFTETLRLVSGVLVIRGITQDVTMKTSSGKSYDLKRGESILFYPPAHHYDEEIFEDPKTFKWDRFIGATFSKNGKPVDKPVMGFGTLCIGQRFATYLSKWYLVRTLYQWRMQLTAPVPLVDLAYQGHEVLPPKCDTRIRYEPRPETHGVRLRIAFSRSQTSPDVGNIQLGNMVACQTSIIPETSSQADVLVQAKSSSCHLFRSTACFNEDSSSSSCSSSSSSSSSSCTSWENNDRH